MPIEMKQTAAARDDSQSSNLSSSNNHPITASSSSFTSLISNPLAARISFQTFTNLLPSSWSASRTIPGSCASLTDSSSRSRNYDQLPITTGRVVVEKREPRFVSKETQLAKLRDRLERTNVNGDVGACSYCHDQALLI
jgi:hypothetical protein